MHSSKEPILYGATENEELLKSSKRTSGCLTFLVVLFVLLFLAAIIAFALAFIELRREKYIDAAQAWKTPYVSISPLMPFMKTGVASDSDFCSTVGNYIMTAKHGSAVDGAISTMLCVGISNCHSTGIGGGSFMVHYEAKTKKASVIDYRETAPAAATEDMFVKDNAAASLGGKASAIPGEIKGYYEAWSRFGKIPWRDLFEPVIEMCRNGYSVSKTLAKHSKNVESKIRADPGLTELLINPVTNATYNPGDIIKNPKLADTFEAIANDPFTFYNGTLAATIVQENDAAGGIITAADLKNYKAIWRVPTKLTLPNSKLTVYGMEPPSSGVVLQFMLGILDGYKFDNSTKENLDSFGLYYHRLIETFKYAYAKRSALGDLAFNNASVAELAKQLIDIDYINSIRAKIDDSRTYDVNHYDPSFQWKDDHGTSHLSLVAPNGDVVATTSTVNMEFGSGVRGMTSGIIYNNEMDDFSTPNLTNYFGLPPSPTNYIRPGKRPMSSMSPVIITDSSGKPIYVSGASGGTSITTGVALIASRTLFLGDTIKQATDYPRLHHQLVPVEASIEKGFPEALIEYLEKKGHTFKFSDGGVSQSIHINDGYLHAHSDYRKGGIPCGQ